MFTSRRLALLSLIVLMTGAAQAGLLPERVVKAIQDRVAVGQYPVVVIGIVDGDRSEVQAYGRLPDGTAPNGDTVFEIGSTTKTFTAALLADAVKKGNVRLDQPVADLLPDWTIPSRGDKKITLSDIATQRSGLPRMPLNFVPADSANPYKDYDSTKLRTFLRGYALPRDPGAQYEYSNLGFALLGTALARQEKTSYRALLEQKIFVPLGMKDSATVTTDAMRLRLPPGRNEQGELAENWDFDVFAPAGAIRSTGNDMLRYLKANMEAAPSSAMYLSQQPLAAMDDRNKIGLAWMVTGKLGIVWHNGMTGGYASFVAFTADRKHGVVILTNAAASVDDLGFATLVPEAPVAPARAAVAMPASALEEYAGAFKLSDSMVLRVFREGDQIYAQATGQGPFAIFPSGPNAFFAKIVPIAMTFNRDPAGKITGLVLHQNGDHPAPKMPDEPAITLDAATMAGYAGTYSLGSFGDFVVTLRDGGLYARLATQPELGIYPSAKDRFFYKLVDAKLDFERDAAGKIVALVLHQSGHDTRAPRR